MLSSSVFTRLAWVGGVLLLLWLAVTWALA
jgi:hypothetical protein